MTPPHERQSAKNGAATGANGGAARGETGTICCNKYSTGAGPRASALRDIRQHPLELATARAVLRQLAYHSPHAVLLNTIVGDFTLQFTRAEVRQAIDRLASTGDAEVLTTGIEVRIRLCVGALARSESEAAQ